MTALDHHPLRTWLTNPGATSHRASSWDRTGGNFDFIRVEAGQTFTLLDADGPGCITHIYWAYIFGDLRDYRDGILRCYWDGEATPSVEVPVGDFSAVAHGRVRPIKSQLVTVNNGAGSTYGHNIYFPMPFAEHALITLENRGDRPLGGGVPVLWYHIEYETYTQPIPDDTLRFHAQYRQEHPTTPVGDQPNVQLHSAPNLDGAENYVALEATGSGQMVGLLLEVDNIAGGWYGEGDDMVFIDGDQWPPSIHGTGSEEIFGGGACPNTEYAGPYSGFHLIEHADWAGLVGMYRWYVHDPIRFQRSIRWTVEHGHANNFGINYSSVAYWYQTEPHAAFPTLPSREELLPPLPPEYFEARDALYAALRAENSTENYARVSALGDPLYRGDFAAVLAALANPSKPEGA